MNTTWKIVVLVILLFVLILPDFLMQGTGEAGAASRTLMWSIVNTPSENISAVIVSPSEINAFALGSDGRTFYCCDTADNLTSNWQPTSFPGLGVDEYISCLDISKKYGAGLRDIAVGTRNATSSGRIFNAQYSTAFAASWNNQGLAENITAIKFSPNYATDSTIAVVSCNAVAAFLHLGKHDPVTNTTSWDAPGYVNYPVDFSLQLPAIIPTENSTNIINCDLELPSDFSGSTATEIASFVSILTDTTSKSVVLYVNTNIAPSVLNITPPFSTIIPNNGIYSIAYKGSLSSGMLLAGEKAAKAGDGRVKIWQCSNPQSTVTGGATWLPSNTLKSPTGGGNSGRANAILAWSTDGTSVYCGTSSENAIVGGTGWAPGQWPRSKLTSVPLDESAFSRSTDSGISWNQLSLIDTRISRLSDVAALDVPTGSGGEGEHNVLYLATLNTEPGLINFDSVWRSVSDTAGQVWERVLIWP
ncbi:MAG: hypothetical protein NT082_07245, partial [Chloroflexi bacterium]|nr:hypothetical protein [Chloroflexota bacterium]